MKAWCWLILCLLATPVWALSYQQLAVTTEHPDHLEGRFLQKKYLRALDTHIDSAGHFSYDQGQQIIWTTETPIESTMTVTPEGMVSSEGGEDILKLDAQEQPAVRIMNEIFFAVLTANWDRLDEYFTLTGSIEDKHWHAILTPKPQEMRKLITSVELSGSKLLEDVVLHESNGDRTRIAFKVETH